MNWNAIADRHGQRLVLLPDDPAEHDQLSRLVMCLHTIGLARAVAILEAVEGGDDGLAPEDLAELLKLRQMRQEGRI